MNKPPVPGNPPAPLTSIYTPNLPELLAQLDCSIAISAFQADKILFISPASEERLMLLSRSFKSPTGIALSGDKMAIAVRNEVILSKNSPTLAQTYPKKPGVYDALYLPRATYYTGLADVHDLHFGSDKLWAVNTIFSCISQITTDYSFTPYWKPSFITELAAEDRCHLNGMAMENGKPRYVTALGKSNSRNGWRENIAGGGIIMDVEANEIISSGLSMPHTPRIWDGKLFALLSGKERLVTIDRDNGKVEEIAEVPGFVRGMAKYGDYVFIGTSKLRRNSSSFKDLSIAHKAERAGFTVIHLPTGAVVAQFTFQTTVDEVYDIQILPNVKRPNIVNTYGGLHHQNLILPNKTFWAKRKQAQKGLS